MLRRIQIMEGGDTNDYGEGDVRPLESSTEHIQDKKKPIDREKANAEVERDEIIYSPEKGTLHKATGKRHAQGGTPVKLNPGDFIFSDFNKIKIDKDSRKLFNLREMGKKKYTPAKVVEQNIKIKDHNKNIERLGSNTSDDIEKTTAGLNLRENVKKLGRISYLQEQIKGLPNGVPELAQDTSPVLPKELEEKRDIAEQHLQSGGQLPEYQEGSTPRFHSDYSGFVENPYLPNTNTIGNQSETDGGFYGQGDVEGLKFFGTNYDYTDQINALDWQKTMGSLYEKGRNIASLLLDPKQLEQIPGKVFSDIDDYGLNNYDGKAGEYTSTLGRHYIPLKGLTKKLNWEDIDEDFFEAHVKPLGLEGVTYEQFKNTAGFGFKPLESESDNDKEEGTNIPQTTSTTTNEKVPPSPQEDFNRFVESRKNNSSSPNSSSTELDPNKANISRPPSYQRVPLTSYQKSRIGLDVSKIISEGSKVYRPLFQSTRYVTPEQRYYNPNLITEPLARQFSNASRAVQLNPNSSGDIQQMYGKFLDSSNQGVDNVQSQNQQLHSRHTSNLANTQNREADVNRASTKTYYDELTTALQNRDDAVSMLTNQAVENLDSTLSKKQAFENLLNTQKMFPTKDGGSGPLYIPVAGTTGYTFQINPNIDLSADDVQYAINGTIDTSGIERSIAQLEDQRMRANRAGKTKEADALASQIGRLYRTMYARTRGARQKGSSAFQTSGAKLGGYKRYI